MAVVGPRPPPPVTLLTWPLFSPRVCWTGQGSSVSGACSPPASLRHAFSSLPLPPLTCFFSYGHTLGTPPVPASLAPPWTLRVPRISEPSQPLPSPLLGRHSPERQSLLVHGQAGLFQRGRGLRVPRLMNKEGGKVEDVPFLAKIKTRGHSQAD